MRRKVSRSLAILLAVSLTVQPVMADSGTDDTETIMSEEEAALFADDLQMDDVEEETEEPDSHETEEVAEEVVISEAINEEPVIVEPCMAATADAILAVAASQIGVSGRPNTYTYWYGSKGGYSYAWCHAFVSWCADQVGADYDIIPHTASCTEGAKWFINRNQWYYRSSGYVPRPGDVIYFDWGHDDGSCYHVGFVEYVEDGYVHTIEGNTSDSVNRRSYALNSNSIEGYGVPAYENAGPYEEGFQLSVNKSGQQPVFSWNSVEGASKYHLKIWRNKIWEGDPFVIYWNETGNSKWVALPIGTYQAYVDADNNGSLTMSNVVEFTVGSTGLDFAAYLNGGQVKLQWAGTAAENYDVKIWKGTVWEGDPYVSYWGEKGDSKWLALPIGRYQAYVDARQADGTLTMSNVVEFTVGSTGLDFAAYVDGGQVDLRWAGPDAVSYDIKIWKGRALEGDSYVSYLGEKGNSKKIGLPIGTYQGYVDAKFTDGTVLMSNVVEFTVGSTGLDFAAYVDGGQVDLRWAGPEAVSYDIKIWKGRTLEGDSYVSYLGETGDNKRIGLPVGTYQGYVEATLRDGTVLKSNVAEFDVTEETVSVMSILRQPENVSAGINGKATFSVIAENAASYQWQYSKNGGAKWINCSEAGNTTDTLTVTVTKSNSVNLYRCVVTGMDGNQLISNTATVDLLPGAVITQNPKSNAVAVGEYATFTVEAENAAGFQWQYSKDGAHWYRSNAEGNQTDTLIVKGEQKSQGNRYRCVVTGIDGNTKKSYMAAMIVMTVAPKDCTAAVGQMASYRLKAEGIATYQWQYSKDGGQTWYKSSAEGATTDTVTFKASTSNRAMIYRCKLTTPDEATAYTKPVGFK